MNDAVIVFALAGLVVLAVGCLRAPTPARRFGVDHDEDALRVFAEVHDRRPDPVTVDALAAHFSVPRATIASLVAEMRRDGRLEAAPTGRDDAEALRIGRFHEHEIVEGGPD